MTSNAVTNHMAIPKAMEHVLNYLMQPTWGLFALLLLALLVLLLSKLLVKPMLKVAVAKTDNQLDDALFADRVLRKLTMMAPAATMLLGLPFIQGLSERWMTHIQHFFGLIFLVLAVQAISAFLTEINKLYERRPKARQKPIKGYLQLIKLVLYLIVVVFAVSWLIGRSPLVLLSGLGALGAVLLLVFKDTILSLVASVQIASNDVLRVGDWIEMPSAGADGDVIDIALHTVKVQNWDKTIVAIPTYKFASETFKNWRGMQQSGNRRIKRAIHLDKGSVRFLTDADIERLSEFKLIKGYLSEKQKEVRSSNEALDDGGWGDINRRRLTNIGTFRAYVYAYLSEHPYINQNNTVLVRQLAPTPQGIPMELYCFVGTTVWLVYESVQADVFDHLLAILPEFGLRLFQEPTGGDIEGAAKVLGQKP